jgi:hypothetical protein
VLETHPSTYSIEWITWGGGWEESSGGLLGDRNPGNCLARFELYGSSMPSLLT